TSIVACGDQYDDDSFTAAVSLDMYDKSCHVPLTATVTHAGKSIQVQIVDRCTNCSVGDLDMTPTAFAALADLSLGRLPATWRFDNW
ncbi:RlpA-like double-psi beta-barrel-protein domain-containing protein-containing protein, partial [Mycena filopes]